MLVKKWFEENEPEVEIATFINTKTVDQLKKRTQVCLKSARHIGSHYSEDFYPRFIAFRRGTRRDYPVMACLPVPLRRSGLPV